MGNANNLLNLGKLVKNRILPVRKHWCHERWRKGNGASAQALVSKKAWKKEGNAETLNLFIAFIVFNVFNGLHCLHYPSLPSLSFCAFYILQCPSMQKAELWALRACFYIKIQFLKKKIFIFLYKVPKMAPGKQNVNKNKPIRLISRD